MVAPGTVDLEFCLGRLEDDGGFLRETLTTTPMSIFTLLVVAAEGRSVLLLDAGRSAVVSWPQGPDSLSAVDLADATAEHLRSSWFRESVLRQDAPLFEVSSSQIVVLQTWTLVGCRDDLDQGDAMANSCVVAFRP